MPSEITQSRPTKVSPSGWLEPANHAPSPNFNSRPLGCEINLLVIHNISLPPSQFGGGYIESFFLNSLNPSEHPYFESIADLKVSAHCLIKRGGEVVQFVSFQDRAWHAGASCHEGVAGCNDYSIGIELEGDDNTPYTEDQYQSLALVTKLVIKANPALTVKRIVGHSDIAPERKTDPGPAFNWPQYFELLGVKPCT